MATQNNSNKLYDKNNKVVNAPSDDMLIRRDEAFKAITKKAMLINITRRQIANMPFDIKLVNTICKTHKIDKTYLIQIRKCLINPKHLISIRSLVSDAVLMVFNNTRPWDNFGYRLLPMVAYEDFNITFSKIKDEFEEAVQVFKDNYKLYIDEAKKDLGKAFDKNDYYKSGDLESLFELTVETSKFTDQNDIRFGLSNDELVKMQDEFVKRYTKTIKDSIKELFTLLDNNNKKESLKLFSIIEALNIDQDADTNLQIATLKEALKAKFGTDVLEKKEKDISIDDSMLLTDDIDLNELEDFSL